MSALAALCLSLVITTDVTATTLTWTIPQTLDVGRNTDLVGADFDGRAVAVAWLESGAETGSIRVKTSADGGTSFSTASTIPMVLGGAIAVCGDTVYVAFIRRMTQGRWVVKIAVGDVHREGFREYVVDRGPAARQRPDVACADARVFVSWDRAAACGRRLQVASAKRTDLEFGPAIDLGLDTSPHDYPQGLAIAASGNTAYAVFGRGDGRLRIKRWSIGPAPHYSVKPKAATIVAPGSRRNHSSWPLIAADGDTVALGWSKCGGTLARVSTDRGATWGPIREITYFDCQGTADGGVSKDFIAVKGDRIMIGYTTFAIFSRDNSVIVQTHNGFESFSRDVIGKDQLHLVGFVVVAGSTRLADVYTDYRRIRFRRQI